MLKILGGLGALYALAWVCSRGATPEQWAESQAWADRLGKRACLIVYGFLGLLCLAAYVPGGP